MANINYVKALLANPDDNSIQLWVDFPVLEEQEEDIIKALTPVKEDGLKRFYSVDEELTAEEINALLEEPEIYDIDDLVILEVDADTDEYELDEAFEEAGEIGLNVSELNEIIETVEGWNDYQLNLFCAVHSDEYRFQIQEFNPNNYIFYEGRDKEDVARDLIYDYYPDFPEDLEDYLNYADWADDELTDYVETDWGTYLSC